MDCTTCDNEINSRGGIIYVRVKVEWNEHTKYCNIPVCPECFDEYGDRN